MILVNGPNTPFGRMAYATALQLDIDIDNRVINVGKANFLNVINPLHQIPTLLLDDDRMFCDSRVICSYFTSLQPENNFNINTEWDVQVRWSLAIGLMENAVSWVMESRRPQPQQSPSKLAKHERCMARVIAEFEAESLHICKEEPRIDRLSTAIALEYIDFRFESDWRSRAPRLAAWLATETTRPSLARNRPRELSSADPATIELGGSQHE